ncbi:MAG: RNA polymerase sigma factor [Deltaproteobacteria bacterium]|nr:RNA polymerase sigma factor [Deltaproteobacteria bacterium]
MEEAALSTALAEARPRVMAALLRSLRDLDASEEAFQEACLRALNSWRTHGLPKNPIAWLILVGRNAGIDSARRRRGEALPPEDLLESHRGHPERHWIASLDQGLFDDDVLRLFLICCHPALAPEHQIALALKVVAGLTVPEIAQALLIQPKALEQRITRAKRRLIAAEANYGPPTAAERHERIPTVRTMIYLLFNEGYSATGGDAHLRRNLCEEAIRLARILLRAIPADPEVMGLLALCLLQHSRYRARLGADGEIILLSDQDRRLWQRELMAEGQVLVEKALRKGVPGPFQVQAAIAAVHSWAPQAAATDWDEIDRLYGALESLAPSPVVTLNRAVAVREARGPRAALALVEPLAEHLDGTFHFHGVRGQLWLDLGETDAARREWNRAWELARTPAERLHLKSQLAKLRKG